MTNKQKDTIKRAKVKLAWINRRAEVNKRKKHPLENKSTAKIRKRIAQNNKQVESKNLITGTKKGYKNNLQ